MIPTFNCAGPLREALSSVLAQDPGPELMHIEVVDDASSADDPEATVAAVGEGRVAFHRQPRNGGHLANLNSCLKRARGRLVHLLHGDDFVLPGFYNSLADAFEGRPRVGAAFCRHLYRSETRGETLSVLERPTAGRLEGWAGVLACGPRLAPPSMVARRRVYEELGGFDQRLTGGAEDWELQVRVASRYDVWFEPEPLAVHRVDRPGSLAGSGAPRRGWARDLRRAVEIVESYLTERMPRTDALACTAFARDEFATWTVAAAREHVAGGGGVLRSAGLLLEALRCSRSPAVREMIRGILRPGPAVRGLEGAI